MVGPGVSTFYTSGDGATLLAALKTFFTAVQTTFPNGKVTWQFPSGGEIIDSATGELVGAWSGPAAVDITAASSNATWAQGVGARITWNTAGFLRGRRVRGSTFFVPLNLSMFDSDGTIVGSILTQYATAAGALVTAVPQITVWSRPTVAGGDGGATPITSGTMADKVSWLRSRRT
jgi:hypothetical protein